MSQQPFGGLGNPQPQHTPKKSPPRTTGRIALKITLYFVGVLVAEFGLLGGSLVGTGSNVPIGCSVFSIGIFGLAGSIFIFFRKGYYFHCLSGLQYLCWISGTTLSFLMAFVLVFVFADPNHNHIANSVAISFIAFYGIALMWIAHMKPPLAQQINESVYKILRAMPGKQLATTDLFARLQKDYKHLTQPLNQYLDNLGYIEPISIPGVPGIVCRMKPPEQPVVVPQQAPPVTRTASPQAAPAPFTPQKLGNYAAPPSPIQNLPSASTTLQPSYPPLTDLSTTPTIPVPVPNQASTVPPLQTQHAMLNSSKPIDKVAPLSSQAIPLVASIPNYPKSSSPMNNEPKAIKTFCCYAHADEQLLNKLKTHLQPQQRQGLIQIWYDRDISAGAAWEEEIEEQLNTAQIILLLVSPDFMASDYCYSKEMERALERHERGEVRAIPVILRPVDWQITPLGKLQALPKDGKPITTWSIRDNAYLDAARGIRAIVEAFLTPPQQGKKQVQAQSIHQKGEEAEVELVRARCTQGKIIVTNKKIVIELHGLGQTFKSQMLWRSSLSSIDSKLAVAPLFGQGGGINLTFRGRGKELLNANLVPIKEAKEIITLLS